MLSGLYLVSRACAKFLVGQAKWRKIIDRCHQHSLYRRSRTRQEGSNMKDLKNLWPLNLDYILKRSFLSSSLNPISVGPLVLHHRLPPSTTQLQYTQQQLYLPPPSFLREQIDQVCIACAMLPRKCFPVCAAGKHNIHFVSRAFARPRNIISNNVSTTMCPRLPGPLYEFV